MTVGTRFGLAQTFPLAARVLIGASLEIEERGLFISESEGISTVPSDARVYALGVDCHRVVEPLRGAVRAVAPVTRHRYAVALQGRPRSGA